MVDVVVASSLSLSFSSGACNEVGGPVTGWYNTSRGTPEWFRPKCLYIRVLGDVGPGDEGKETKARYERDVDVGGSFGETSKEIARAESERTGER